MSNSVSDEGSSHFHLNGSSVHRVSAPHKKTLAKEFKSTLKETFFPDDPFRQYRDKARSQKFVLALQSIFPVLDWIRSYTLKKFVGDLIAGLTIASLCIPQDIGYAGLAGLPGQYGLYSSFVPPLIYAVMGSSRDIAIGPVAVVSLLIGALLQSEIDPKKHPVEYRRLAFTATFFVGITQVALGIFRLGFIVDFLSHAAVVGFMAGAAVTIALQQLKGLLGIKDFTNSTDIVSVLTSVFHDIQHEWNWQTIVIGVSFLVFLLITRFIGKKNKKLFWISAIAPFISVVLSTVIVYATRADKHGVKIVGSLTKGLNPSSVNEIYFTGPYVLKGFKIGVVVAFVALTEAIAIARTFAAIKDYNIDGNKEMLALGVMNLAGSMTSCYASTGSFSRSSVNFMAGCQTTVSNVVMSLVVMLTLLVITPLFYYTPSAILAAIIINAVIGLIDINAAVLIWKIDKFDFLVCLGAFLGVIFVSVEIGLLIAVSISVFKILFSITRPHTALLGNIPETTIYRNVDQYPNARKVAGILILRVDSAIYFSNSNYVKERILRWFTEEDDEVREKGQTRIQFLIIEMAPVINIDTSGIHALEDLCKILKKRGVQLVLANPGHVVVHKLQDSEFFQLIGEENIFLNVSGAVQTCTSKIKFEVTA